jgi:hypothetical protein
MYKTFIKKVLFLSLSVMLLFGLFNFFIDPYSIVNLVRIEGINKNKPYIDNNSRLTKAAQIIDKKPEVVILGSSRVEFGINPDSKYFNDAAVYNAGLANASIYEMYRYLEHSIAQRNLKKAVIGLDFFAFFIRKHSDGFDESVLGYSSILPYMRYFFSLDMFNDSKDTIKKQNKLVMHNSKGFLSNLDEKIAQTKKNGYRNEFLVNEVSYIRETYSKFEENRNKNFYRYFEDLLLVSYENSVELTLFISPVHARQLEALDIAVGYEEFQDWKKRLVDINLKVARNLDVKPYNIWDFSGYNSVTTEEFPANNGAMTWYWESSHYTSKTGDLILKKAKNNECDGVPSDFGVLISEENIDSYLKEQKLLREKWLSQHKYVRENIEEELNK